MLIGEIQDVGIIKSLSDLGYRLEIPLSVYGEIKYQFADFKKLVEGGFVNVLEEVHSKIFLQLKDRYPQLGNGEIEVLAHGLHYSRNDTTKYYCVLDDELSRKVAEETGVKYTGTLGLLNFMCKKQCFSQDEINELNNKLDNCRVPDEYRLPF